MNKEIYPFVKTLLLAIVIYLLPNSIFSQNSFQLNGNGGQADLGNDCYQLTQASNNQYGSAWWRKKADLNQDFDLTVNLNFGTKDGNGADGIVFAFQNVCTSSGGGGGGIGINGVTPSLFVEFDTWQNGNYNDPVFDHVAIMKNGDVTHNSANQLAAPVGIEAGNPNVENGQDYLVHILWTHADSTLKVFVSNNLRISYTGNVVANIFSGNPYVYWGFTAATGGSNNLQKFCMVSSPTNTVKLNDAAICIGGSYQASLPGYSSYNWAPNTNISNTTTSTPVLTPTNSTTYFVTVTDACNNQQTDSIRITVNPLPNTQLTLPFSTICTGTTVVTLSGGSPINGTYTGAGVSGGQFTAANAGAGPHWIYYTASNNFNCSATDSNLVLVNTNPNVTIAALSPVCVNSSAFTLSGGSPAGGSYTGTGVSGGNFDPATAGAGTHVITYSYTDPNTGCNGTATSNIIVHSLPATAISAPNGTVICNNASVLLTTNAVNGVTYQWSLGNNTITNLAAGNTSITATAAGSYTLMAVSNGCSATSTATVITNGTIPSASITSATTTFCPDATVVLNSSLQNNETIQWYLGNTPINNATTATYSANTAGVYKAVITSNSNCSATSNTITLTQLANPNATAVGSLPAFCPSTDSIVLTATSASGATLQWLSSNAAINGATNTIYAATNTGSYSVEATLNGCKDTSATIVLNSATNPTAVLSTVDSTFCPGTGEITVTATAGATYMWFMNGSSISGSSNVLPIATTGIYHAVVTSSELCSTISNSINMTVQNAPTANISASDTTVCSGSSVTLTADTASNVTYEWKRNGNSLGAPSSVNTYSATLSGTYICVVSNGCSTSSNAIEINVSSIPASPTTLLLGGDNLCVGGFDNYQISPVTGATGYSWAIVPAGAAFVQQGQGTEQAAITFLNQNCTIQVSAFNSCGTSAPASLPITISNTFACNGTNVAFGASPSNTCVGSTVTFYNFSNQTAVGSLSPVWDFGAGASPATSTSNGPVTVTYSTPGFKDVSLSYNDVFGNYVDGYGITNYVNVNGSISTSAINGNTQLSNCQNNSETYSVANTAGSTYNWVVTGGNIISGQGTNSISVSFSGAGGSVTVTETNAAGCIGTPQSITVTCPVGLQNIEGNILSLYVYPNPTTGLITVKGIVAHSHAEYQLQVVDLAGRTVQLHHGSTNAAELNDYVNLNNLAKGVYFIRIKLAGEVTSRKIVLQ